MTVFSGMRKATLVICLGVVMSSRLETSLPRASRFACRLGLPPTPTSALSLDDISVLKHRVINVVRMKTSKELVVVLTMRHFGTPF